MQLPRREGTPDASVRELNEASDQELLAIRDGLVPAGWLEP